MVLYIIGLGLGDEKDITVRGLETVKKCSAVFLEFYTSMLGIDNNKLVRTYSLTHCLSHSFTASLTHCITH
jgi:diphthine synthase